MIFIVLILVAPFAFIQAFVNRGLPTFAEQIRRAHEGTAAGNPFANYSFGFWITWIVQYLVITPIVAAALLRVLIGAFFGKTWSTGDAVRAAWRLLGPLVAAFALSTLASVGPQIVSVALNAGGAGSSGSLAVFAVILSIAAAVGSFVLSFRLLFTGTAVIVDGERGLSALQRSWRLSVGSFWKLVGNLIVASLLAGIVIGLLSLVPQEIAHANDGAWWLLAGLGTTITTAVVTPFLTAAQTLLDLHCRVAKEGLTLERLEQQMRASDPDGWRILPAPPNS